MDGVPESHYPRWVRRLRGATASDQNRSCKTILSIPDTKISSHRTELNQNSTVSAGPSIRFSTLSPKNDKANHRRELVTVPTIPLADRHFFFRCAVINETKPDEFQGMLCVSRPPRRVDIRTAVGSLEARAEFSH